MIATRRETRTDAIEGQASAWSSARIAAAVVLGSWSGLFLFLLLTGRGNMYLSTRTAWVVPVGAVVLGLCAMGALASAKVLSPERLTRRGVTVAAAVLVPVVLIAASPRSTLGSFSVGKKASATGASLWTYWGTFDANSEVTLFFVTAAQYRDDAAELLADRAGSDIRFDGFVSRDASTPVDEFFLTRFVVSCCVADAAVARVRIVNVPPGRFASEEWVEVRGQIYPVGNEIIVVATSIEKIDPPDIPYLTP